MLGHRLNAGPRLARSCAARRRRRTVHRRVARCRRRGGRGRRACRPRWWIRSRARTARTFERAAAERRQLASHLRDREAVEGGPGVERDPRPVGASAVITYAQCPKRFYWSSVRPLPRFSGPAARIGTEIHAWIERRARGQGQLLEIDDRPDLTDEELAGDPGRVERLRDAFLASRFADVSPLFAERAFLLRLGEFSVGGRIDAIFGDVDGPWEVVDWKTGRKPSAADPTAGLQLDIYGLAAVEIWGKAPADVALTYFYLASGEEVTHRWTTPTWCGSGCWLRSMRSRRASSIPHPARGAGTATSGASATRGRRGSRRSRGRARSPTPGVRSSRRTGGSRLRGRSPLR